MLTKKQKMFADSYLETGNATRAVKEAGYNIKNDGVASTIGSENIRKVNIKDYLISKADAAASMIFELSQSAKTESVRLSASKDILDRAGLKPTEKKDITTLGKPLTANGIQFLQPDEEFESLQD